MFVTFGDCRLDLDRHELYSGGNRVHLTPKAFELLRVLVENRTRAVSKAELFDLVWHGVFVSDDSIARLVAEIRSALGETAQSSNWLRTIRGYGYTFAAPVQVESEATSVIPRFVLQCGSRQFLLSPGDHVIGRDASSAILMHSPAISRRHACVSVTGAGASIEDLGSKNGTFVGDVRLNTRRNLHEGDRISVGEFVLVFTAVAGMATETFLP